MISPLWLRALLIVSLAFNIAVGAMWATHPKPHGPFEGKMPDSLISRLTHNLSQADTTVVKQAFDSERNDFEAQQAKIKDDFSDVQRLLRADPVDTDSLRGAMNKIEDDHRDFENLVKIAVLQAVPNLSPQGRISLFPEHR